ncbi:hypothetical protein Hte_004624 [Hypoxylon texense]
MRVLQKHGVPATEEMGNYLDISESEVDEDDRPDWEHIIVDFAPKSSVIPNANLDVRTDIGRVLANRFIERHCKRHRAEFWKFPKNRTWDLVRRVHEALEAGGWPDPHIKSISEAFRLKIEKDRGVAMSTHVWSLQSTDPDPDHVPVVGLDDNYRVWRVVPDGSVDGAGMTPDRYYIPPALAGDIPMQRYHWWGAEVVSPVYPAHNQKTYDNIRKVCGILRDHLRIHKPMEVSTGLHVHMGHKHGWTLLHLKKFVTLWTLVEETLINIHRKDRGSPRMAQWCGKLMEKTCLAAAIHNDSQGIPNMYSQLRPMTAPMTQARLRDLMQQYVPVELLSGNQTVFLTEVWEYTTIDELIGGMGGSATADQWGDVMYNRTAARMRISGEKFSEGDDMQTIEIRTMQGTVDAEHIIHWIHVLERVLFYTRRADAATFRDLVQNIQTHVSPNQDLPALLSYLEVPRPTVAFFLSNINRDRDPGTGKEWFVYPDRDRVDWGQPFMVRGYAATHGAQYNFPQQ